MGSMTVVSTFIVAMVDVHGAPDQVTEVGFLTRFVGFEVTQAISGVHQSQSAYLDSQALKMETCILDRRRAGGGKF